MPLSLKPAAGGCRWPGAWFQAAGCRLQWSCVSALRVGLKIGSLIPQQFLGPTRCFASCELQQCLTSRRFGRGAGQRHKHTSERSSFGRGKILSASRGQYCCIDHFSSCLNCGSRLNPFLRCLCQQLSPETAAQPRRRVAPAAAAPEPRLKSWAAPSSPA